MIKVQLWGDKVAYNANKNLKSPNYGLFIESCFEKFPYLHEIVKLSTSKKAFCVSADTFKESVLNFSQIVVNSNAEYKQNYQKLIDDFKLLFTNHFDNFKDMIVVISED